MVLGSSQALLPVNTVSWAGRRGRGDWFEEAVPTAGSSIQEWVKLIRKISCFPPKHHIKNLCLYLGRAQRGYGHILRDKRNK